MPVVNLLLNRKSVRPVRIMNMKAKILLTTVSPKIMLVSIRLSQKSGTCLVTGVMLTKNALI